MPATRTAPPKPPASPLAERLKAAGIVAPRTAVREAKRAGLPLELACALLEKESSGGRNVYGHDPTIFVGAGKVTRANYAEYKRRRVASGNRLMQGVGPCQLTWWELQDAADADGGCWHPEVNMRVGFRHLATLVERYGRADGARRYNGSGAAAGKPAAKKPAERDVRAMAADLRKLEEESSAAWRALVARGHRRRRRLLAETAEREARANGREPEGLTDLLAVLTRIEGRLGTLVTLTEHRTEPADGAAAPAPATPPEAAASANGAAAPAATQAAPSAAAMLRELEALDARRRELRDKLF